MTAPIEVIADEAEKLSLRLDPKSLIVGYSIGREWGELRTEKDLRACVRRFRPARRRETPQNDPAYVGVVWGLA